MSAELKDEAQLEIGHVLFMDIVAYSKLVIDEQREVQRKLNEIVRSTEQFHLSDAAGKLVRLPTGDGMALVFRDTMEAPVRCAREIAKALHAHPGIHLRMGVHSGPVSDVTDVNERANIAGDGVNIAQRVMACGDAGHILLSKRVAEDLVHYGRWRPQVHELGEVEIKHGVKIDIFNLCGDGIGNAEVPEKIARKREELETTSRTLAKRSRARRRTYIGIAAGVVALAIALSIFAYRTSRKLAEATNMAKATFEKSVAVLPFENLSRDPDNAFLSTGIQDEILTRLAKIAALKVIARTSTKQYESRPANLAQIAKELGVAAILEGSVQKVGGTIRVNVQLIKPATGAHLWAETYDRELIDVLGVESDVATKIAFALRAALSPEEKARIEVKPTDSPEAYALYLRAVALIDEAAYVPDKEQEKDFFQAVELLNQAIARDPAFLLAYCRLAEAHDELYFQNHDHTPARLALANSAINVAFRLKPDSGEAHLASAAHFYHGYFDYDHARDELAIAVRTLPNNARIFEWTGYIDRRQGRWHDAVRNLKRASELDPRNVRILFGAAITYNLMSDYEQARETLDRLIALEPNNNFHLVFRAWNDVAERADTRPFHAVIEKILRDDPAWAGNLVDPRLFLARAEHDPAAADRALAALTENSLGIRGGFVKFSRYYLQGLVARMKGDTVAARVAFTAARAEQEEAVRARPDDGAVVCLLGLIDAALGRKEEALREGRQAVELLPVAKNAVDGADILYVYAVICAQTGERDLAIEQLETLAKIPAGESYGELRLDPEWDPLRGDPRFEKIVASVAPKSAR